MNFTRIFSSKSTTTTFSLVSSSKATRRTEWNVVQRHSLILQERGKSRHSKKVESDSNPEALDHSSNAREFPLPSFDGTVDWDTTVEQREPAPGHRNARRAFYNRRSIRLSTFISCHIAGLHRLGRDNRVARRDARLRTQEETDEDGPLKWQSTKYSTGSSNRGPVSHLRKDRLENPSSNDTTQHGMDRWKGGIREHVAVQSDAHDWRHDSDHSSSSDQDHDSWGSSILDSMDDID